MRLLRRSVLGLGWLLLLLRYSLGKGMLMGGMHPLLARLSRCPVTITPTTNHPSH